MNYGELKTLIEGYLHRADQTDNIVNFISLAQSRINHDLKVPEMITRATLAVAAGDRFVTVPTDLRELFNVQVSVTGGRRMILPLSLAQMDVEHATVVSGIPSNYSFIGDQLELQPTPGEATTMEIVYLYRFAKFSLDTDTNELITNSPNLYVYATMVEATPFIQADERMPLWSELYKEEVARLNEEAEDRWLSGGPLQIRNLGVSTP